MWGEDDLEPDPLPQPTIEVEVTGPEILGTLYGPTGEVMFTLVDRPVIPFGFRK